MNFLKNPKLEYRRRVGVIFIKKQSVSPKNINLLCNYGNLKKELNDIRGSILLYKKAYKINNNHTLVLQNLASSYLILGKTNLSKKYLNICFSGS